MIERTFRELLSSHGARKRNGQGGTAEEDEKWVTTPPADGAPWRVKYLVPLPIAQGAMATGIKTDDAARGRILRVICNWRLMMQDLALAGAVPLPQLQRWLPRSAQLSGRRCPEDAARVRLGATRQRTGTQHLDEMD